MIGIAKKLNSYINSYNQIQPAIDNIILAGGGTLEFQPGCIITFPSNAATIMVDTSYVSINFNRATINVSACPDGHIAFKFYSSLNNSNNYYYLREIRDLNLITNAANTNINNNTGVTGFLFDSDTDGSSNRVQVHNCKFRGLKKAISFHDRSYFVRFYDCTISGCLYSLYQEATPSDFAEKTSFINCVFGNGYTLIYDAGGLVWTFLNCSFDYHVGHIFELNQGASVTLTDCHIEWKYGLNPGETLTPFVMKDANTSIYMKGGKIVYNDASRNPYYTSLISCDNSSQKVILHPDKVVNLGRAASNTTSFDAIVECTGDVTPFVDIKMPPIGTDPLDCPAATMISTSAGIGGLLRNGLNWPNGELVHRTAVTGAAAIANITAGENGVSLKRAENNLLKISGIGTVIIALPNKMAGRRCAWSFFVNPAFITGSIDIKERWQGFGEKFDGTTITISKDNRPVNYSPTTKTVNAGTDVWSRVSWKDCNTSMFPSKVQALSSHVFIVIDTTNLSAGAAYLADFSFDYL